MLIDMAVLAALSWLVAKALNMVFFKTSPASTVVAWTLTIGYFLISVIIASVMKTMRHSALNESLGLSPSYQNPLDMATAFLMAYVFYLVLNTVARSRPSKPATASKGINPPTAVYATPPLTLSSGLALPAAQTPAPTTQPPHHEMPKMEDIEDGIYAQVGEELESGNTDKGIWTKAFAHAGGDDKSTRVSYIQLRVAKLLALEEDRQKRYAENERIRSEQLVLETTKRVENEQAVKAAENARIASLESDRRLIAILMYDDMLTTPVERSRIIEQFGGSVSTENQAFFSSACSVSIFGETHSFRDQKEFSRWARDHLGPRLLAKLN
jgi:hypothetical protein